MADKVKETKVKKTKKTVEKTVEKEDKNMSVLVKPRVTEKSVLLSEGSGVYAFNVKMDATKKSVIASVKAQYKVTPVRVRLLAIHAKVKRTKNILGTRTKGKKAYVYLKKGDKIDIA